MSSLFFLLPDLHLPSTPAGMGNLTVIVSPFVEVCVAVRSPPTPVVCQNSGLTVLDLTGIAFVTSLTLQVSKAAAVLIECTLSSRLPCRITQTS
jgi:hypothetical protein